MPEYDVNHSVYDSGLLKFSFPRTAKTDAEPEIGFVPIQLDISSIALETVFSLRRVFKTPVPPNSDAIFIFPPP